MALKPDILLLSMKNINIHVSVFLLLVTSMILLHVFGGNNVFFTSRKYTAEDVKAIAKFMSDNISSFIDSVKQIIGPLGTFISAFYNSASEKFSKLKELISGSAGDLNVLITNVVSKMKDVYNNVIQQLSEFKQKIFNAVMEKWDQTKQTVMNIYNKITTLASEFYNYVTSTVVEIKDSLILQANSRVNGITESISVMFKGILDKVSNIAHTTVDIAADKISYVKSLLTGTLEDIKIRAGEYTTKISDFMSNITDGIKSKLTEVLLPMKSAAFEFLNIMVNDPSQIIGTLTGFVKYNYDVLKSRVINAIDSIIEVITDIFTSSKAILQNFMYTIADKMLAPFQVFKDAFDKVRSVVYGIKNVIETIIKSIVDLLRDIIAKIDIAGVLEAVRVKLLEIYDTMVSTINTVIIKPIETVYNIIIDSVAKTVKAVRDSITTVIYSIYNALTQPLLDKIVKAVFSIRDQIVLFFTSAYQKISDFITDKISAMMGMISTINGYMHDFMNNVISRINDALTRMSEISTFVYEQYRIAYDYVSRIIGTAWASMGDIVLYISNIISDIKKRALDMYNSIADFIKSKINAVIEYVTDTFDGIMGYITGTVIPTVSDMISKFASFVWNFISNINIPDLLKIPALQPIADLIYLARDKILEVWNSAAEIGRGVLAEIQKVVDQINPLYKAVYDQYGKITEALTNVYNKIVEIAKAVYEKTKNVIDTVTSGLSEVGQYEIYNYIPKDYILYLVLGVGTIATVSIASFIGLIFIV